MGNNDSKKDSFPKDLMYYKFCLYGFLKNQRFFDPFIILFFREMGMSFFQIGTLFSIREIATNILEIPTGVFADAFGRRKSMIICFVSYLISFAIFSFFPNFYIYGIAMIFFASGEAFRSGTHKAMILEYLKIKGIEDKKVTYYGHTRSCSQFGSALSSLIAVVIVFTAKSYKPIFLYSMIPYVMELFLMMSYPKYLDGIREKTSGTWLQRTKTRFTSTIKDFLSMFKNKHSLKAILNSAIFSGFFKSSKDYLQPILKSQVLALPILLTFAKDQRVAVVVGGVYFILYFLTGIASRNADKIVKRSSSLSHAINITYIIGALILIISGITVHIKLFWIGSLLFIGLYIMQNMRRPMNVGYISDKISNKTMASGLSVESQIKTIITAVLAPAIGYAADIFGVGIALTITGILFILIYPLIKV